MTTRNQFNEELGDLKLELVEMCRFTESMIEDAVSALIDRDPEKAKSVPPKDKKVDEMELDIERKCLRMLLKQQPVARDFRDVSTTLKVITDIERIGDQASDIAEIVAGFNGDSYIKKLVTIPRMGLLALNMVHGSVDSFIKEDVVLADSIIAKDDEMDGLFETVKNDLIKLMKADSENADQAIMLMMVAKYFERIGDHAVNVCEWTKYFGTGVHVKY